MLNREINAHGLISFLWRQEWEVSQNITEVRMEVLTDLDTDIYALNIGLQSEERRVFALPCQVKSVLSKTTADGKIDLLHIRHCIPLIFELFSLRRQEGSRIPVGCDQVRVVGKLRTCSSIVEFLLTSS